MKPQALVVALISMAGVCDALGQAWFYTATDCAGYEKKDKAREHTSGAYPTYDGKCHNDETNRKSLQMGKDLDKHGNPWASCMRISSGPWCTGETVGLDVLANDQCYSIPQMLGNVAFNITSFRLELGSCSGGEGPNFETLDKETCRWGINKELK